MIHKSQGFLSLSITAICPKTFSSRVWRSLLTLTLLTWRIWWAPNNASKWQMGFNSAFKGLMACRKYMRWYIYFKLNHKWLGVVPHAWGLQITLNDAPQSVGLFWTSDQSVAETSTWQQHTALKIDRHLCPRWDSNPQSLQESGRRPTPQTARPLGPATIQGKTDLVLRLVYGCLEKEIYP